jgi:hypothetical protein
MHLAQFNVARLRHPLDDPRSAEFKDNLELVNGAAKRMPGFIWVLEDDTGTAVSFRIDDDEQMIVNLSVWETAVHLKKFVFGAVHGRFYKRRELWFEAIAEQHLVLWPIPIGDRPTLQDAAARLAHLRKHGPSETAFGWKEAIGEPEIAALRCE